MLHWTFQIAGRVHVNSFIHFNKRCVFKNKFLYGIYEAIKEIKDNVA